LYDNTHLNSNVDIFSLYDSITTRSNLNTRDQLKTNYVALNANFTRLKTSSFLTDLNTAGDILEITNPDLKNYLNAIVYSGQVSNELIDLSKVLSSWIKTNISTEFPNLPTIIFGFSSINDIIKSVNFFKPYRSRLIVVEHNFIIDNPMQDTVITEDRIEFTQTEEFVDFDTADSIPGYEDDITDNKYYSRNNYDTGSYFDIGASIDLNDFQMVITQNDDIIHNYHKDDATFDFNYTTDSTGEVIYAFVDSGWSNFDSGMVFDSSMQSDNVSIYVIELP
jgi:hypothetical protein